MNRRSPRFAPAEKVEVRSTCGCGCASIGFTWVGKEARYRSLVQTILKDDEDQACGVTLFVDRDAQLSYLEIYSLAG
jgi:hypothetical protein